MRKRTLHLAHLTNCKLEALFGFTLEFALLNLEEVTREITENNSFQETIFVVLCFWNFGRKDLCERKCFIHDESCVLWI